MNARPAKAVVLAAGLGARMDPLTSSIPKPMLPMWNMPLVERTVRMLVSWGVSDVLLNLHHGANAIFSHFRKHPVQGTRVSFSFEPVMLGTAGALRKASWFLGEDAFWLVNGDILANVPPQLFLRAWRRSKPLSVLWLTDRAGPRTVEMEGDAIRVFRSNRPGTRGTFTMCGLHLLSPRILSYVEDGEVCSLVTAYERALSAGERLAAVNPPEALWIDIGTPEGYLEAHRQMWLNRRAPRAPHLSISPRALRARAILARSGAIVRGFVAAEGAFRASPGAVAENSVLLDGVTLASSARLVCAVAASGVAVRGPAARLVYRADAASDPKIRMAAAAMNWPPSKTLVMPLPPRGSARTFARISSGDRTAMLIRYSLEREENAFYAPHARWLSAARLPVPRVLLDRPSDLLCVMQDVGDLSLLEAARDLTAASMADIYEEVLQVIVRWHQSIFTRRPPLRMCEPFSADLFEWEHNLFVEKLLVERLGASPVVSQKAKQIFRRIASDLADEQPALLHRDLQSSNIHIAGGKIWLIDFQGMRVGPAMYDVASLLADPYVNMPLSLQERLLATYARLSGRRALRLEKMFWTAAAQRLSQALGAYARLAARPETSHFQRHIIPGLIMLDRAAARLDDCTALREIATWAVEREHTLQ